AAGFEKAQRHTDSNEQTPNHLAPLGLKPLHPPQLMRTTSGVIQDSDRLRRHPGCGSGCDPGMVWPKWTQSRTITGTPITDRSAVTNLISAVVANIEAAQAVEKPFFHLVFERVFPDDVYAEMVDHMPSAADYRPLPGRGGGNLREDGS